MRHLKKPDKFDSRNCIALSTARHEVHSHRYWNVAFIRWWIICSTNSFILHARNTALHEYLEWMLYCELMTEKLDQIR